MKEGCYCKGKKWEEGEERKGKRIVGYDESRNGVKGDGVILENKGKNW